MTAPSAAELKLRELRRMKLVAASLLLVAAVVFVVSVTVGHGHGAWGFVQAAAEAAMVGGLADWFAVTALFRHPLGIPIPHTAIIPRKKDQIGTALAGFVQQNFLTGTIVAERLEAAQVPRRLGEWLAVPDNAAKLADDIGSGIVGVGSLLKDEELRAAVIGYLDRRLHQTQVAPALSRVIEAFCDSGQHQVALSAGLRSLMRFLQDNRAVFRDRVQQESPEWVPAWIDERVFSRGFVAVQSFLADVRLQFDSRLRSYANELRTDPAVAARVEEAKNGLLDRPDVHDWLSALWTHLKASILAGSADPRSELQRNLAAATVQVGQALTADAELRARVDDWLGGVAHFLLSRYAEDVSGVISATVARWDAADTGRRLELQVGRDLQFIRVNGTVVGAMVGVLIYGVGRLL
jgi:uncharacterized membrane-anchored protein YjiN (DUF445 family)